MAYDLLYQIAVILLPISMKNIEEENLFNLHLYAKRISICSEGALLQRIDSIVFFKIFPP